MSDVILENKWSETKTALMDGLSGQKQKVMDVVLENTRKPDAPFHYILCIYI